MNETRFTWTLEFWKGWINSPNPSRTHVITAMTEAAVRLLDPKPGELILNAGCGYGREASAIYEFEPAVRVVGVDISHEMAGAAKSNLKGHGFAALTSSAERLPFPDATFDKVLSLGVVMHVSDESSACSEMYRVLKPGGAIIVSFNNLLHPLSLPLMAYLRWSRRKRPGYKQSFRLAYYYRRRLGKSGEGLKLYPISFSVGIGGGRLLPLWKTLDKYLAPVFPWATYEPILYGRKLLLTKDE